MADYKTEKIIQTLLKSPLTGYYIAQKTGITEQTILNYRNKKTVPTDANAKLLEYFFREESEKTEDKSVNQSIVGDNNIQAGSNSKVDARKYYSDSPDVLRAQIDEKDRLIIEKEERIKEKDAQIKEKDAQIKEKDAQIKEKDAQINKLLSILSNK